MVCRSSNVIFREARFARDRRSALAIKVSFEVDLLVNSWCLKDQAR